MRFHRPLMATDRATPLDDDVLTGDGVFQLHFARVPALRASFGNVKPEVRRHGESLTQP